jgi:15-cis-phytoene synthase
MKRKKMNLYNDVSYKCSQLVTKSYSTSFSLGVSLLHADFVMPIHAIYGFVRFADEIVDTFHSNDKRALLDRFTKDTHDAIADKISLNPILQSFQDTVNKYNIDIELVNTFLRSMAMDLDKNNYNQAGYEEYILGSAEVVGLMCLKIFVEGDEKQYLELKHDAMKLGSAFQKINFLRDLKADVHTLGRAYFPGFQLENFNVTTKKEIEADIQKDFDAGLNGIKRLPRKARLGVYLAYIYYISLFKKIQGTPPEKVMNTRIRVSDRQKYALFLGSYFKHHLNLIN